MARGRGQSTVQAPRPRRGAHCSGRQRRGSPRPGAAGDEGFRSGHGQPGGHWPQVLRPRRWQLWGACGRGRCLHSFDVGSSDLLPEPSRVPFTVRYVLGPWLAMDLGRNRPWRSDFPEVAFLMVTATAIAVLSSAGPGAQLWLGVLRGTAGSPGEREARDGERGGSDPEGIRRGPDTCPDSCPGPCGASLRQLLHDRSARE